MYAANSQDSSLSYPYGPYALEQGYSGYDDSGTSLTGLSSTPPSASFAATGLPFRGLEFIRNYSNSGGYAMGEQDSLWHSYDPGAFEYNPDLPFTLGDLTEAHDGPR